MQENIASIRAEISSEAEVIEMASRIRIENFTLASNGKNKAQSFYITEERKARASAGWSRKTSRKSQSQQR